MKAKPNEIDTLLKDAGYKYLGWENSTSTQHLPEYKACHDAKHIRETVDHDNRGLEHTVSCDICKIYWKYDSSD